MEALSDVTSWDSVAPHYCPIVFSVLAVVVNMLAEVYLFFNNFDCIHATLQPNVSGRNYVKAVQ